MDEEASSARPGGHKADALTWIFVVTCLCVGVFAFALERIGDATAVALSQFGDFFGGTVGPILSFVTFAIVIFSFRLQKQELELTRLELIRSASALESQELAIQQERFERSFFQMLSFLNEVVDNLNIRSFELDIRGRGVFRYLRSSIENSSKLDRIYPEDSPRSLERAVLVFDTVVTPWSAQLGHYFRFLYRIFILTEKSAEADHYAKIIRSQISDDELVILFYNCFSEKGRSFQRIAVRFALFDNLNINLLMNVEDVRFLPIEAFGKNIQVVNVTE